MNAAIGLPYDPSTLSRINLNHLVYFWAVARAGSVTAAATSLGISQSAVSEQLRTLEHRLGATLLERTARGVKLTAAGERTQRYAEEIVALCGDLVGQLPISDSRGHRPLAVGTSDSVPKVIVRSLIAPLLDALPTLRVVCREWRVDHLLSELSLRRLDVVLTDTAVAASSLPRLTSFSAGSSAVTLCAAPQLTKRLRRGFPRSLDKAPFLLPVDGSPLRQSLDRWFSLHRLSPQVVVEAEDRSQLHHFGESGHGIVPVASVIAPDLQRQFGLVPLGSPRGVREEYFAVVVDRKDQHPMIGPLQARLAGARGPGRDKKARLEDF